MEILFLGATKTVTGSKYLLTFGAQKILLDCGLFQGFKGLRLRNWDDLPVRPHDVESVILSHAHIDHSGYIPLLIQNGFRGPIYSTSGTKDLCAILLPDSGHLQEEEANFANRHNYSKHHPALPLYTREEAEDALKHFQTKPYDISFSPIPDLNVKFLKAGHIIGASIVRMNYKGTSIVFTGDLGRPNDIVMRPPALVDETDYLVVESTYGNRLHEREDPRDLLAVVINRTVKRGGSIIIPSFAVGRAQNLLYYIMSLKQQDKIPDIPVFLDSPMSINATDIFCNHLGEHRLSDQQCDLMGKGATYVRESEGSKKLDSHNLSRIIISASGMATGGRILHHLKFFAPDPRNTILFTGYQADGTRGDRMIQGEEEIRIFGEMVPLRAEVVSLSNTSAHADYEEILGWLSHFKRPPKKTFITHGSEASAEALRDKIHEKFGWDCVVPNYLDKEILK
ncbi:MBL fold metallo-hydrolase [Candidatus Bealeia paramacronuclearis]|uniref:MBL fold metallo-hydrolase n=1 Tax=Candidatus Bealeia paramacronuclearis TaxID=1921001 RepID=A0ABZ2C8I7_9PROT|nr:MBL fold metallo-hydrolase [Candidatus Bealeia paramacronuclearis]